MSTTDVAGAQHNGFAAKLLKIRRFSAKRYCLREMAGQAFGHANQLSVSRLFKRRHASGNGGEINVHLMPFG